MLSKTPNLKLYIAGPMTGYVDHNLPAFARAKVDLDAAGYDAVNPGARGEIEGWSWSDYLREDLTLLVRCDAVAVLPGWESSKGASLETYIAKQLDMEIDTLASWLER